MQPQHFCSTDPPARYLQDTFFILIVSAERVKVVAGVGGGGGDGGEYRAPVGGRFDGYVPRWSFNDFGPYHCEVEHDGFGIPPFGFGGDRRPFERREMGYGMHGMIDYANPSVEQMTRHWFASHFSNPSVGSFAHPMPYY